VLLQWDRDADYAYLDKGIRLHDWAWEFLRRNPAYQAAYQRYVQAGFHSEDTAAAWEAVRTPWGLTFPVDPERPYFDADALWEEQVGPVLRSNLIDRIASTAPHNVPVFYVHGDPDASLWSGFPERATFSFDLQLPIEPQIKEVRERLLECQAECLRLGKIKVKKLPSGRGRANHYRRYVRLLDGHAAGVGTRTMAPVLFALMQDPRDSARAALEAALKLTNGGYRKLLLKPNRLTESKGRK
jgi:transcriptional regulator/type VI secretion system activator RovC-like protein